MTPRKITYIANIRIPTEKAHGLQIMKSCEAFAYMGIDVSLMVPKRMNPIKEEPFSYYGVKQNFNVVTIPGSGLAEKLSLSGRVLFNIQAAFFTLKAIRYSMNMGRKDSVFYSRDIATLFLLCLRGLRPVAEIHDYRLRKPSYIMRTVLRKSSKIVVNSRGTLSKLREHYQAPESKYLVVPNGVDISNFDIKETKENARIILGIDSRKKVVAYVGRVETAGVDKGVGLLLKAFGLLFRKHKDTVLYVIGGPNESIPGLNIMAGLAGIASDAVVFTGHVEYKKIPMYLRAVDLVVIPLPKGRHAETTSPVKLFEFMAAGKAVIAPDFPSIRECVDSRSVILYNPGDVDDLYARMTEAIESPDIVAEKERNMVDLAKDFTWKKRAEKIIKSI